MYGSRYVYLLDVTLAESGSSYNVPWLGLVN